MPGKKTPPRNAAAPTARRGNAPPAAALRSPRAEPLAKPLAEPLAEPLAGLRLGAHESIAGGLYKALERAEEHGAEAVQIFTKSARGWASRPLSPLDISAYREASARSGLPSVAHASYLINLAAEPGDHREKSIAALADDWQRSEALGLTALVVHPGSHADPERGEALVAAAIDEIHRRTAEGQTLLLLENTAGQGSSLGWQLDRLAGLLAATDAQGPWGRRRVGVCLDTCHLFAAGYDLSSAAAMAETLAEVDARIGLARVRAFHLNDSKGPRGNRLDRHENIGEGHIGTRGFEALVNDGRLAGIPACLETDDGEQQKNLAVLKALRA